MDWGHFKELLLLHLFLVPGIPPSFLWWKNVYILIFGIKKNIFFKGSFLCDSANFSNLDLAENLKNEPNHRRDPLKSLKFFYICIA